MAKDNDEQSGGLRSLMEELPFDRLKDEVQDAVRALGDKAFDSLTERINDATDSLTDMAEGGGVLGKVVKGGGEAAAKGENPVGSALKGGLEGVKDKVKSALPGGGGSNSKATKSTNIIESIDVGVPIDVAYNQWTQFQDFSGFMKKVESVDQQDDVNVTFKAQVFWSHRKWDAHIIDQVPNERIIWKSKGEKGHVDGAVTFHELAPSLTRILVVLEYYPQGLFERTGNLWRAQGRRARLELKHFRRHVMTRTILDEDGLEGWRGEIHDGEVQRDHDEVVEEEEQESDEAQDEDSYDDEVDGDEEEYDEPEDEASEEEYDDEPDDEPEDEADDEPEDEAEDFEEDEDAPEDEADDEEDEDAPEDEAEDFEEGDDEEDEEPDDEEAEDPPARGSSGRRRTSRRRR